MAAHTATGQLCANTTVGGHRLANTLQWQLTPFTGHSHVTETLLIEYNVHSHPQK